MQYRDGPTEKSAVHEVRINRVIEKKATPYRKQDDNIRSAELYFMLDLETLIEETLAGPDLIELQCCLKQQYTKNPTRL